MTAKRIFRSLRRASRRRQRKQLDGAGELVSCPPRHLYVLLEWRLTALGINPKDIERYSPVMLASLRNRCALCAHKRRCLEGMMEYGTPPGWDGYCPNAVAIRTLSAHKAFAASLVTAVGNRHQSP
jgi:hypothetical protein